MKKVIFTLLLFHFLLFLSFGQETKTTFVPTLTLNFLPFGTGLVGELPISKNASFRMEFGGIFAFSPRELSYTSVQLGVGFSLYGSVSYRYYHNLGKLEKSDKLLCNSGNFVFAQLLHYAPPLYKNEYFNFDSRSSGGVGYGFQRILKNRFVFSLGVGLGYYLPQKDVFFIGDLTLGILLRNGE